MTVFWLGMFAACLWLVVGYALVRLARQRPAHPFRSIRRFRAARRRLAPEPAARTSADIVPALEAGPSPAPEATDDNPPPPALQQRAPRKQRPPRKPGPRRLGKLTYILVDEDGMPETPELLRN